jgi:hypothetical protein
MAPQRSSLNFQLHRMEHIVTIEKLDEFAASYAKASISRVRCSAVRDLHKTYDRGVLFDECRNDLRGTIG